MPAEIITFKPPDRAADTTVMDSRQATNLLLAAILIVLVFIAYDVHHAFYGNFVPGQ